MCAHFISRISFTKISPNDQNSLFFYCVSGKMAWAWREVSYTDLCSWHVRWNGGPLENQYRTPACGYRISAEDSDLASHFDTVRSPGTGLGLCPLNLGLTVRASASEIFVWLRDCFASHDCQLVYVPVLPESPRVTLVMGPGSKVRIGASKCHVPAQCVLNLEKLPQFS